MLPWLSAGFAIRVSQILCFIAGSAEPFIRQRPSGVGNRMVLIGVMERDLHWYKFFPSCNTEHSARVMLMKVKRSCAMSHPLLCLHWPSLSLWGFSQAGDPNNCGYTCPAIAGNGSPELLQQRKRLRTEAVSSWRSIKTGLFSTYFCSTEAHVPLLA